MKSTYTSKYGTRFEYTLDNCVLEINETNLLNVPLTIATDGLSKTEQEILWDIVCKQREEMHLKVYEAMLKVLDFDDGRYNETTTDFLDMKREFAEEFKKGGI